MRTYTDSAIRQTKRSTWATAWRFAREQRGAATLNCAAGMVARDILQRREDPTPPTAPRALAAWYLAAVRIGARRIGLLPGAFATSVHGLRLATRERERGCYQHLPQ
jgi:hypothetical protein